MASTLQWHQVNSKLSTTKDGKFSISDDLSGAEKKYRLVKNTLTKPVNLGVYRTLELATKAAELYI